jgi:hypothetical protein
MEEKGIEILLPRERWWLPAARPQVIFDHDPHVNSDNSRWIM